MFIHQDMQERYTYCQGYLSHVIAMFLITNDDSTIIEYITKYDST